MPPVPAVYNSLVKLSRSFIDIWFETSNASCVFIVHFSHSFGCTVSSIERREPAGTASGDLIHCELL